MNVIDLILYVLAAVLLFLEAIGVEPGRPHVRLGWLGLTAWVLVPLLHAAGAVH